MSWFNFNKKYHDELPIVHEYVQSAVHHELPTSCEYIYDLNSLPATTSDATFFYTSMSTTSGAAVGTTMPQFVPIADKVAATCDANLYPSIPQFESTVPPKKHMRIDDAAMSGTVVSTSIPKVALEASHTLMRVYDAVRSEGTLSTSITQFAPLTPNKHMIVNDIRTSGSTLGTSTLQFVPVAPDKPVRVDGTGTAGATVSTSIPPLAPLTPASGQVFEIQSFRVDNRRDQEEGEQQHKEALMTTNTNGLNNEEELMGPVQAFLPADLQTTLLENPDKEDGQDIDLNRTPIQKQRRKKHRPKVVIEGKTKRTPKSGTPKTDATENPTGKRKYVRRNVPNKAPKTPSEVGDDLTDLKTLESAKKSCRRALNFETEAQQKDGNCAYSSTLGSETQANHYFPNVGEITSTVQASSRIEVLDGNTKSGISYVGAHSTDGMFVPEREIPRTDSTKPSSLQKGTDFQEMITEGQMTPHAQQDKTDQLIMNINSPSHAIHQNFSNCRTSVQLTKEEDQVKESKREFFFAVKQTDSSSRNLAGAQHSSMQQYQMTWMQLPNICKKKRTTKGQNHTIASSTSCCSTALNHAGMKLTTCLQQHTNFVDPFGSQACCWLSGPHFDGNKDSPVMAGAGNNLQDRHQCFKYMMALNQHKRTAKRTPRSLTGISGLASLTRMTKCNLPPIYATRHSTQSSNEQMLHTCIDALIADRHVTPTRKKRTKRNISLAVQNFALCNKRSSFKSAGTPLQVRSKMFSIDAITEQLHYLDINRGSRKYTSQERKAMVPYDKKKLESNMLVLYKRDGTIAPYEGSFDSIKRCRPRPRVDLDDETNRVWRLLLENINSEGIDGTDEEKTKWWEEERRVFRGRADSFIARMHLVQGQTLAIQQFGLSGFEYRISSFDTMIEERDRRFSPWKGSVVDSVVGVFLTQNVSDHLSSSAFMSLAARFPYNSMENSASNGPAVITEKIPCQPFCNRSSVALQETECLEFKAINSSESVRSNTEGVSSTNESEYNLPSLSETRVGMYHSPLTRRMATEVSGTAAESEMEKLGNAICDVISSQNSVDSSASRTADRFASCSESNSEVEDFLSSFKNDILDKSTSFTELLWNISQIGHMSTCDKSKNTNTQPKSMESGKKAQETDAKGPMSSLSGAMDPLNEFYLHQAACAEASALECSDMFREETQSVYVAKNKDESSGSIESTMTVESASQDTIQNNLTSNFQEATQNPGGSCSNILGDKNKGSGSCLNLVPKMCEPCSNRSQSSPFENPEFSAETLNTMHNTVESGIKVHSHSLSKKLSEMNAATTNPKSKHVQKEKKDEFDWDNLRKQAETNGRKREKTANTMDSLDWDAVRCVDVNEIANAIKERGMNNMLAERIKDFLNRLVREHGSIDLEWLRDVPPDQAKEYLLSFRGLGLKSVECVRLLTLHHLAFPVDTNVGRIAVRLGWVPLQPLPESLQLHLLELYPVLESIQKYLWPRLCKLDQRTLYELHYQMITFGKVFCTKSKPNCNACPMRGECRHFASAFASARLALPGIEEKGIVSTTGYTKQDVNHTVINDRTPLPLPHTTSESTLQTFEASEKPVAIARVNHCEPIIEEPASPEPEHAQVSLKDIEDSFNEDLEEIPTIKLNIEEFSQNVQNYMQESMQLQESEVSKALVALTSEAASLPVPKLKNVNQLRTEHYVYELPDLHPLLDMLLTERREPDDPCPYLLAIWTPGETPNSIQPPEKKCSSQEFGQLCYEKECFSCNSVREANSQTVRGTLLIPCRTAMRGSFPLNGTYFQVNEVFADHESSLNPIDVPRNWLWNLTRRTVYFGTSIPTIFKGLSTQSIQQCFWRGFVCVRGFDRNSRAPRPLIARLHFPASKLAKTKDRRDG